MADGLVEALAAVGPGDTTGSETFARYHYQCKVAVHRWLATIEMPEGSFILCEFIDDITTVTPGEVRFAQVKTRDRGAWTAAKTLEKGGGLDALVRSYNLAKLGGITASVQFELILEGPAGTGSDTTTFFSDPKTASNSQRSKLVNLGLAAADVDDFLARLTVVVQYHARASIDAVTIWLLMALAPGHTATVQAIYKELLERAQAASVGTAVSADAEHPLAIQHGSGPDQQNLIGEHALSRAELLTILPPVPTLEAQQRALIEAANEGSLGMTSLEWKLRVAGANDATIERAKARRSSASAKLASRPTLDGSKDPELEEFAERVLEYADAVTADVVGSAAGPAQATRPAEIIYGRLVQQAGQLARLDRDNVLDGDGSLALGLLCELSDQCRFAWRSL